jgi:hypothetical protein
MDSWVHVQKNEELAHEQKHGAHNPHTSQTQIKTTVESWSAHVAHNV